MPDLDTEVLTLERVAARGWCGTTEVWRGDWLLRAAAGFTGRANSVLPLGPADGPLDDALDAVDRFYAGHGLRPLFQVPECPATDALDTALDRYGWVAFNPTSVMVADLVAVRDAARRASTGRGWSPAALADRPTPEWLAGYRYRGSALPDTAEAVLLSGTGPVFATLSAPAGRVAVARAVVTDGWLGVTAVTVRESARRAGAGTAVMADLFDWGAAHGAHQVYLQVARENQGARALYGRLGFVDHHGYHYRRPRD
ncbi:GNAT family N-acetyltransferase [Nakamurella flava]|uniref:GNAT family N-acetyltransferase n=1 Tax=Nakamurella flava TaxID=2576308 RepID=A0A4V6CS93_9ACTN|nr:GNAT family N-acetyltransferase [Nakamurella flava]TKV60575.1 GNAT family N-acetyltransferase [Nakamurella flava]